MIHSEALCTVDALGNTYPVREDLKKLGFKWDGVKKCWTKKDVGSSERAAMETMTLWGGVRFKFHSERTEETPF